MLRSRIWRRFVPLALVVGFAIFLPVRGNALPPFFESSWQRLAEILSSRTLTSLFANNGIDMDPNGKPAPGGSPIVVPGAPESDAVVHEPGSPPAPQR